MTHNEILKLQEALDILRKEGIGGGGAYTQDQLRKFWAADYALTNVIKSCAPGEEGKPHA